MYVELSPVQAYLIVLRFTLLRPTDTVFFIT